MALSTWRASALNVYCVMVELDENSSVPCVTYGKKSSETDHRRLSYKELLPMMPPIRFIYDLSIRLYARYHSVIANGFQWGIVRLAQFLSVASCAVATEFVPTEVIISRESD